MHLEKSAEQLNMKFIFSKDVKKNGDMTKKDAIGLGALFVSFLIFAGTLIASDNTVAQGTTANKLISSILHVQKDIRIASPLLTDELPNFFKFSSTDANGNRYLKLVPYFDLIKKLAKEEKQLLDNNTTFDITKFDNLLVNNYLINDEFYFKTLWTLKDSIPAPTLMHMIKNHFFIKTSWNDLAQDMYERTEERLLASNDINMIYVAMTQLDLDNATKLKYSHRLEKLISMNMKKGNETWHKYIDENESALLYLKKGYFEKKATRKYSDMLEDIYKIQRPIMTSNDYELMENYKEKILEVD